MRNISQLEQSNFEIVQFQSWHSGEKPCFPQNPRRLAARRTKYGVRAFKHFQCKNALVIILRGAGEMATGVAVRLYRSGFRRLLLLEQPRPLAVRRTVSLCEAVYDEYMTVEDVTAVRISRVAEREAAWAAGRIPLLVDAKAACLAEVSPDVVIEVTLAKRNVGVTLQDAPLVIGVGPGFTVQQDVHRVIESNRGPNLGRVFREGSAEPNTGIPGTVKGLSVERVLRAPATGVFVSELGIGARVEQGQPVGFVNGVPALAGISGIVRGLLRPDTPIDEGVKIGDIEPREGIDCFRISEKALAIGGGVLEAILEKYN